MIEFGALFRKEWLEIMGGRVSRHGTLVQGAVFVLILGVFVPSHNAHSFRNDNASAALFYGLLPGILAASIAADAFAGERERHTLETLLATPLSERVILFGKLAAAVAFGLVVAIAGLGLAIATVNMSGRPWTPSLVLLGGSIGAAVASTLLMSSVAIVVSMLVPVARIAQQISGIGSVALLSIGLAVWMWFGFAVSWRNVVLAEIGLAVLAFAILDSARILFRRDRFFERSQRP